MPCFCPWPVVPLARACYLGEEQSQSAGGEGIVRRSNSGVSPEPRSRRMLGVRMRGQAQVNRRSQEPTDMAGHALLYTQARGLQGQRPPCRAREYGKRVRNTGSPISVPRMCMLQEHGARPLGPHPQMSESTVGIYAREAGRRQPVVSWSLKHVRLLHKPFLPWPVL